MNTQLIREGNLNRGHLFGEGQSHQKSQQDSIKNEKTSRKENSRRRSSLLSKSTEQRCFEIEIASPISKLYIRRYLGYRL